MQKKASILIADDNNSLCRTMSLILGRKGYAVTTARDGPEAIERVKEKPFDIIFLDIKMPAMSGTETYKRLKEIRPEAVVVMMTAYALEDLVQDALREGAYGILYKPLEMEKVLSLIQEASKGKKGVLVLIVDDDPGSCTTLKNILTRKGYEVSIAHTGEEAIARAPEKAHDVIFIDVKLPVLNGLETYLGIKEVNPKAVVIMMTGHRQEMADLVEEALSNNAYTCLYKPFDMGEVLELVEGISKGKRKAR